MRKIRRLSGNRQTDKHNHRQTDRHTDNAIYIYRLVVCIDFRGSNFRDFEPLAHTHSTSSNIHDGPPDIPVFHHPRQFLCV